MLAAIILAAVVILGGIVVVAMGLGGELARGPRGTPRYPVFQSAADVTSYRPPASLLGYDARATEQALRRIGEAIADRDAEIAWLRTRLRELAPGGEPPSGVDTRAASAGQVAPGQASLHGEDQ